MCETNTETLKGYFSTSDDDCLEGVLNNWMKRENEELTQNELIKEK